MFNRSFINLFSLVVLNSIGAGLLNLVPSLAPFGVNSFVAWNLSATGCFAIVMALLKVGVFYKVHDYAIQNLIAAPFEKKTAQVFSRSVFWGYLIFGLAGNGAIAISMMVGLRYFFPFFITSYEITSFFLIFFFFYFLNRFGISFSKGINIFLFILKVLIMCVFPIIALLILPSKIPFNSIFQPSGILRATFLTIWPFVGIESVLMERDVDRRSFVPAMISGLVACLFINMLNNYLMIANIRDLANCSSPYSELFKLVFPNSEFASIFVNLAIIVMTFGSLYGWIYIGVASCISAEQHIPPILMRKNTYGIPEPMLIFCCFFTPLGFALIKTFFPKTNAFGFIIDTSVAMILTIYALGIIVFAISKRDSWKSHLQEYKEKRKQMYFMQGEQQQVDNSIQDATHLGSTLVDPSMDSVEDQSFITKDTTHNVVENNVNAIFSDQNENINRYNNTISQTNLKNQIVGEELIVCPFMSWFRANLLDFLILVVGAAFVVFAFIGSDPCPTMIGLALFAIPFLYFSIV